MSHVSKVVTVGGWEGLLVAVVIVARRDALRGDTKAAEWIATVAPYVLGWVFSDIDPAALAYRLLDPPRVVPLPKGKQKRAA